MDHNISGKPTVFNHIPVEGPGLLHSLGGFSASNSVGIYLTIAVCLLLSSSKLIFTLFQTSQKAKLPTINAEGWVTNQTKAKENYVYNARSLIQEGFKKFGGPFYLKTDSKDQIMLPPDYIEAVNKENGLSFTEFTRESFLSHLSTFQNFRPTAPGLFEEAVMKGLTRNLPLFTKPLSDEMTHCLDRTWSDSNEWHEVALKEDVLNWVSRLSARIFVPNELCENEDWLQISIQYTVDTFKAVQNVKLWPSFLHRYAEIVDPLCIKVRAERRKANEILAPVLQARKKEILAAKRENRKPVVPDDSIEWFRNAAHGREYDDTNIQLGLSLAAIHTTSDLLSQAILNLCKYPEAVQPLREEAVEVLSKYGWQKVALTEVRLLDSFLKETQRVKPIGMASMHRLATRDVEIPATAGGPALQIPKGQHMAISSHRMWDENIYEDPTRFDFARFAKRRQIPAFQHSSHLVSTSKDHMAFSHGKHACPGRFFAANETKIAMLHLIMKYDMKLDDPNAYPWIEYGAGMNANPGAKIRVRRRQPEIDLDALKAEGRSMQ